MPRGWTTTTPRSLGPPPATCAGAQLADDGRRRPGTAEEGGTALGEDAGSFVVRARRRVRQRLGIPPDDLDDPVLSVELAADG